MSSSVFDFSDYKLYVANRVGAFRSRSGQKVALARAIGVQPTMVSLVLNGNSHFSLEQAERVNHFLGHTESESDYFFLLVQEARAGTQQLQSYFKAKRVDLLESRQEVINRLGKRAVLSKENQGIYYSSWHFAAFHIAVSVPSLRSRETIANFFKVPIEKVTDVMEELVKMGLVTDSDGVYGYVADPIYLGYGLKMAGRALRRRSPQVLVVAAWLSTLLFAVEVPVERWAHRRPRRTSATPEGD